MASQQKCNFILSLLDVWFCIYTYPVEIMKFQDSVYLKSIEMRAEFFKIEEVAFVFHHKFEINFCQQTKFFHSVKLNTFKNHVSRLGQVKR